MREFASWLEISLPTLAENTRKVISEIGDEVLLMAVVKSNAYGHGLEKSALTIWSAGAAWLCVTTLEEGVALREAGIKAPILVLGYIPAGGLREAVYHELSVSVFDLNTVKILAAEADKQRRKINLHVKIDTGMHRLGIEPEQSVQFFREVLAMPRVHIQAVFSHFGDALDREFSLSQVKVLQSVLFELQRSGIFVPMVHFANSLATFLYPGARFDGVRVGRALYGGQAKLGIELPPVMTVKARVVQVKRIVEGDSVGYTQNFKAKKRMVIAVLGIGYGDGLPFSLSNRGEVLISGRRCPIIGNICMNMCMVDVTHIPVLPKPGEEAVIIGSQGRENITALEVAERAGTTDYEVLTGFSPLLHRVNVE